MINSTDPRFIVPNIDDPQFIKICVIGYGLATLAVTINIFSILRSPTSVFPNLCLLLGTIAPFYFMDQLAIPGDPAVGPFDPNVVTGKIHKGDTFALLRLVSCQFHTIAVLFDQSETLFGCFDTRSTFLHRCAQ